jgi:hypothetical protein
MEFCRGTHKIVLFRKSLVPFVVKKRYGIRRNKIFILTFILPLLVVLFFSILLESKKSSANLGFRIDKKLSPDRSVLNLF